ncbi:MAG: lipoprotein [Pseudohongiellaceae bacterium]|jgi:predicted small lipoprotein YifL
MNIRNLFRPGKPFLMAVLCGLLLLGLSHCGQKGGLTRPEQATTATG